jgi:hypothetical protein
MNAMRLRQLTAVFRLEIGKSFFARRGLWIYLLALFPVFTLSMHALERKWRSERRHAHGDPAVTREKVAQVHRGMDKQQVLAILPHPRQWHSRATRQGLIEFLHFEGRDTALSVRFLDGRVTRVRSDSNCDFTEDIQIFAAVFQHFYIRLCVFFGCVFVFLNLFRGEMLDRSLHYYFLAPVRRELVVAGKYLAGLVATVVVFGVSVALQQLIYYGHLAGPALEDYLTQGGGWQHAAAYVGVTALACAGYGSVFLAAGVLIRNPLVPAAVMLLWESINGILPLALRRLSVIYYLKSLVPVEVPMGRDVPPPLAMLALNVEAAAPWVAVLGLLAVSAALITFSAMRARKMEITYAAE